MIRQRIRSWRRWWCPSFFVRLFVDFFVIFVVRFFVGRFLLV